MFLAIDCCCVTVLSIHNIYVLGSGLELAWRRNIIKEISMSFEFERLSALALVASNSQSKIENKNI